MISLYYHAYVVNMQYRPKRLGMYWVLPFARRFTNTFFVFHKCFNRGNYNCPFSLKTLFIMAKIKTDTHRKRIAKAMEGNSNAEKWTEKVVIDVLKAMIDYCMEEYEVEIEIKDEEGTNNEKDFEKTTTKKIKRSVHLKKSLLVHFHLWDADWFENMKKKFAKEKTEKYPNSPYSPTVLRFVEAIDMILESNSYNDAASGKTISNVTMMHLSTHYGYRTKEENTSNVNINGGVEVELPEADQYIKDAYERVLRKNKDAES